MSAPGFEQQSTEELFNGYLVNISAVHLTTPDGSEVTREVVHHPGAVAVVAVADDDTVIFERQYRATLDVNLLEIPAGKRDLSGEPPLQTARRELIEEAGYEARHWSKLGEFYNSPGFTDEHTTLYLATGLIAVDRDVQGPEEQAMQIINVPLDGIWNLISSGELVDGKSIIALSLALRHLGR